MRYKFTKEQAEEIEAMRKKNRSAQKEKRLWVLSLRARGMKQREIEELTRFSHSHVCALIRMYFENGIEAFAANRYQGHHRNMSMEQEQKFVERFRKKAEQGHIITVQEIKEAYEQEVGHRIGGSQIYLVLRRQGWRKVMPRSKHPNKASEEAIEASKKLTLV